MDLAEPAAALDTVKALSDIAGRRGDMAVSAPDNLAVVVTCPDGVESRYMASSRTFLRDNRLELRPIGEGAASPRLVITPDQLHVVAGGDDHPDGLSDWLSQRVAHVLNVDREAAECGAIDSYWTREGEKIRVSYAPQGLKSLDAAETLGIDLGEGMLAVVLREALISNGALTGADGSIEYRAPKVSRQRLVRWLALVSLVGLTGSDVPEEFENVRLAASFTLSDGRIEIEPAEGAPGLLWSEVDGEEIVLFSGSGSTSLADFRAKVEELKNFEPEAEVDVEPGAQVTEQPGR